MAGGGLSSRLVGSVMIVLESDLVEVEKWETDKGDQFESHEMI